MPRRTIQFPWITVALAIVAYLIDAFGSAGRLQLDRAMVWPHVWQVVTCQFAHWSSDHFRWDAVAFLLLGAACECVDRRTFIRAMCWSTLLIPLIVLIGCPQFAYFRGLSGIDSALLGLLLARLGTSARKEGDHASIAMVAGVGLLFCAKCLYEIVTGRSLFVSDDGSFAVVPLAHLAGFVIGVACVSPLWRVSPSGASRCVNAGCAPAPLHPPGSGPG